MFHCGIFDERVGHYLTRRLPKVNLVRNYRWCGCLAYLEEDQ